MPRMILSKRGGRHADCLAVYGRLKYRLRAKSLVTLMDFAIETRAHGTPAQRNYFSD